MDMLSLSSPAPAEAPGASSSLASPSTVSGTGAAESFGAVVGRLLEADVPSQGDGRPAKAAPVGAADGALVALASLPESDGSAFLLALTVPLLTVQALPVDTLPAETLPAETLPAETLPAETLSEEASPADPLPLDAQPAGERPGVAQPGEGSDPEAADAVGDAAAVAQAGAAAGRALALAPPPLMTAVPGGAAPSEANAASAGGPVAAPGAAPGVVDETAGEPLCAHVRVGGSQRHPAADVEPARQKVGAEAVRTAREAAVTASGGDDAGADGVARLRLAHPDVRGASGGDGMTGAGTAAASAARRLSGDPGMADTAVPAGVPGADDTRAPRMSPQAARLAAFLAQGEVGRIRSIAVAAASSEVGRLVAEPQAQVPPALPATAVVARSVDLALSEQAVPAAARDASAKFVGFQTTVAALADESLQVQGAGEAGFGAGGDASTRARDRGAYDLRSALGAGAMGDRPDGRTTFIFDPRFSTLPAPGAIMESAVPTGSLPAGTQPAMGEVPTQIVRAMHLQWRQGIGEARLTLTPESLGEITIALKVENGTVTASVKADNPVTMEWIRSHQHELRSALDAQGLKFGRFDVSVDPDDRRRQPDQAPHPQVPHRPAPSSGAADAPRFELHV